MPPTKDVVRRLKTDVLLHALPVDLHPIHTPAVSVVLSQAPGMGLAPDPCALKVERGIDTGVHSSHCREAACAPHGASSGPERDPSELQS